MGGRSAQFKPSSISAANTSDGCEAGMTQQHFLETNMR
jgi:hypothetical protein